VFLRELISTKHANLDSNQELPPWRVPTTGTLLERRSRRIPWISSATESEPKRPGLSAHPTSTSGRPRSVRAAAAGPARRAACQQFAAKPRRPADGIDRHRSGGAVLSHGLRSDRAASTDGGEATPCWNRRRPDRGCGRVDEQQREISRGGAVPSPCRPASACARCAHPSRCSRRDRLRGRPASLFPFLVVAGSTPCRPCRRACVVGHVSLGEDGLAVLLALLAGSLDPCQLLVGAVELEDVTDEVR